MRARTTVLLAVCMGLLSVSMGTDSDFIVNTPAPTTPFPHFWEQCVGSCHATTALRADWREELTRSQRELGWKYVRFHGLLDDDMSVVLGARHYSFVNIDSIFDFLRSIAMRPYIELSFMPTQLASGANTVFWYRGNITPAKNMADWNHLIDALVHHLIDRYGLSEVAQWYFEVWNEPNLSGNMFWTGGQAAYFEMLSNTTHTIHAISPRLRVGGPASSGSGWIPETIAYMNAVGETLDFVSTHTYPTDDVPAGGNRRDVVLEEMTATHAAAGALPVIYSEWNSGLLGGATNHDTAYAAAFYAHVLPQIQGLMEIASIWTFSDIFEENGLQPAPFSNQYGLVSHVGVPKPAFRALQQLRAAGDQRVPVQAAAATSAAPRHTASSRVSRKQHGGGRHVGEHVRVATVNTTTAGCWALRNFDAHTVTVIAYNYDYYDYRSALVTQNMAITIAGVARTCEPHVTLALIDDTTVAPRAAWQSMGSPTYPTQDQILALNKASEVPIEPVSYTLLDPTTGDIQVTVALLPYSAAFFSVPTDCM